ncbi:hypothetical protein E2562_015028 [Oryza meyeriana var. granulata]|uniref:GLTSCR protein conserved domain-containing protein n=1 Tax=Oryza meyeriana var. granulata TaxID=110450 RepID=A0A6G1EJW2_9ORYZ|nr:hypothetical protein E2562_015028 [Oryza meyeriana var. granulata]
MDHGEQVPMRLAPEDYQRQLQAFALRRQEEAAARGGQAPPSPWQPPRHPPRLPAMQVSQSNIFARPPPPPTQQQWSQSTFFGRPPPMQQQQQGFGIGGGGAGAAVVVARSPWGMVAGPRLAMQQQQPTIPAPPPQPQQQGFDLRRGAGAGAREAAVVPPSPRGMAAGPRHAVQLKQPILAPPPPPQQQQQEDQGVGFGGAGAGAAMVSSSPRGMMAVAAETEEEARARERTAEQIAHEDALKACNPDLKTPFASVEDAISRLLPYHVFAEYEEDEIYVEDQPPLKNKSSVEEWDDSQEAEATSMAEELEKQVLIFNVAVRNAAATHTEERLKLENLLLADEQRMSERVRAVVRQRQVAALQQKQAALHRQRALQQQLMLEQQMMAAQQQQQRQPAIMPQEHPGGGGTIPLSVVAYPDALDVLLDTLVPGGWDSAADCVKQLQQQEEWQAGAILLGLPKEPEARSH